MGLFSRKDKPSRLSNKPSIDTITNPSNLSIRSVKSSLRSPLPGRIMSNRVSSGGASSGLPTTPSTPFSSAKIDPPPDPAQDPVGYLRCLGAVRERSRIMAARAQRDELKHFDVDLSKFGNVVSFVSGIIKRDYDAPYHNIPPHSRYQHFAVGGRDRVAQLLAAMPDTVDVTERCRRIIDLFLVSVLLDAGAGTKWSYTSVENGRVYRRSEGIAVASIEMFKEGIFSSHPGNPLQVDKDALRGLTVDRIAGGLQSRPGNEMAGVEGRTQLLVRLADALEKSQDFFGPDGRPGNMVDYLLSHPSTQASSAMYLVPVPVLWNVLINGLAPIWPDSRTKLNGVALGDAWHCESMPQPASRSAPQESNSSSFSPFPSAPQSSQPAPWESILPFHKLTQWLCYSLMHPMTSILNIHFAGTELLTGLPEYRNGGLFVDLGVLTLKPDDQKRGLQHYSDYCRRTGTKPVEVAPMFEPGDDVIVEWRAVTVGFLDQLLVEVNKYMRPELGANDLSLAQLLEAGSWKGGREIAEVSRPNTKEPPILIDSDGTVF